jgi:hypothetical protein
VTGGGGGDATGGGGDGTGGGGDGQPHCLTLVQSTGLFKTGAHSPVLLCIGLVSPMQLSLSRNDLATSRSNMVHSAASLAKKFCETDRFTNLGRSHTHRGTSPVNRFRDRSSCSTLVNPVSVGGIAPVRLLPLTSNTVAPVRSPASTGRQPVRLLLMKTNWSRVAAASPMLRGMHPPRLLLARTITVALDLPMVSGMPEVNLLLLRKMAS